MSLYEILSMVRSLERRQKGPKGRKVSDEEWAQAEQMLAAATLNDPSVVVH